MAPRPGRIHKQYKLPFASMGLKQDLRDIKNDKEFVTKREEILSMIWDIGRRDYGKRNLNDNWFSNFHIFLCYCGMYFIRKKINQERKSRCGLW